MQCQGTNKDGTLCSRKTISNNFCWQHQNQLSEEKLVYNLDQETELLMYSYITLEEILTIFSDDIATRDLIIKRYFNNLPTINEASADGNLETVKYLISLGIKPNNRTLEFGSYSGNLELVKYLMNLGLVPDKWTLSSASFSGNLELVKYLIDLGFKYNIYTLNFGSGSGNLELVKYLIGLGLVPDEDTLNSAIRSENSELIKYLRTLI